MIKIYPTTASGLSADDYSLKLVGEMLPLQARPQRVRTTLDGSAFVSKWQKRQDGASVTKTFNLKEADFEKLLAIAEHTSVFSWVVASLNRRYECTIDITSAKRLALSGFADWECEVVFTIIEVLT